MIAPLTVAEKAADAAVADGEDDAQPMTRDGLCDGSLLAAARARASAQFPIRSDQEIAASLRATLAERRDQADIWVFGYGSLIWNPALDYVEKRPSVLQGWHRRFCLASTGRGTPEQPGLMLALDTEGSCDGVAYRLAPAKVEDELLILWHREMLNGSYLARWLDAQSAEGVIPVLTFVANRDHARFIDCLGEAEIVERIAFARGPLGSGVDYLRDTIAGLAAHGLRDVSLESIAAKVEARLKASTVDGAMLNQ